MRLSNKVALITGAGSGIGRESAILFAKEGAQVVVCDVNLTTAKETVSLIKALSGQAIAVQADVSKAADAKAMIDAAEAAYGKLNVLFNVSSV